MNKPLLTVTATAPDIFEKLIADPILFIYTSAMLVVAFALFVVYRAIK